MAGDAKSSIVRPFSLISISNVCDRAGESGAMGYGASQCALMIRLMLEPILSINSSTAMTRFGALNMIFMITYVVQIVLGSVRR